MSTDDDGLDADEREFRRIVASRVRGRTVSLTDVHWAVMEAFGSRMLKMAENPERRANAELEIVEEIVPRLAKALEMEGLIIEEYGE
jgi:hypothetical protein